MVNTSATPSTTDLMDLFQATVAYVNRFFAEVPGMKVLLLDTETSQLLSNQVYLIDKLDNESRERLVHLKCICFIRPDSCQALVEELRSPKYGEYHIYFSNILKKSALERLAESDEQEVVKQIQEFYADYVTLGSDLFLVKPGNALLSEKGAWDQYALLRVTEGILGVLLSLKKRPSVRYQRNSALTAKLAKELHYTMGQEHSLFDFRKQDTSPLLILLDRKNDPVSPLLTQWTYQAMVHDLLTLSNNITDLSAISGTRPELHKIILACDSDAFFARNLYAGFGDLGERVKEIVVEYQRKHEGSKKVESVEDMKRFLEDYPEFRKQSFNVTKHVTLISTLSQLVTKHSLLEISELEQSLATTSNHALDLKSLLDLIARPIKDVMKIRLAMLYALRYEKVQNQLPLVLDSLRGAGVKDEGVESVLKVLALAGNEHRLDDLYGEDVITRTKQLFKPMQGAENVYTQHRSNVGFGHCALTLKVTRVLEQFVKLKVKEGDYPSLEEITREKPQDIILFFIGGVTYGECRDVDTFRQANPGVRVIIGATSILNPQTFVESFCMRDQRVGSSMIGKLTKRRGEWRVEIGKDWINEIKHQGVTLRFNAQ